MISKSKITLFNEKVNQEHHLCQKGRLYKQHTVMLRVYDKVMDIWDLLWFVDGYIIIQRVACFLFPNLGEQVKYLTQK